MRDPGRRTCRPHGKLCCVLWLFGEEVVFWAMLDLSNCGLSDGLVCLLATLETHATAGVASFAFTEALKRDAVMARWVGEWLWQGLRLRVCDSYRMARPNRVRHEA